MMPHLYRKTGLRAIVVMAAVFLLLPLARAQVRDMPRASDQGQTAPSAPRPKKTKRGPRALAVVEFLPGGATRLVPVALWIDGKYYDASLYGANPEPMALEPGTVYEAQLDGEPTGTFVVNMPKQLNGSWVGDGRWKPHLAMDEKLAADAAKKPKPKAKDSKAIFTGGPDEGPPVLKRADSSGASSNSGTQDKSQASSPAKSTGSTDSSAKPADTKNTQTASAQTGRPTLGPEDNSGSQPSSSGTKDSDAGTVTISDPNRPVLKRAPAPDNAKPASSASDDDPDRPVYTKPPTPTTSDTASPSSPSPGSAKQEDPDRPVLSRGAPAPSTSASTGATAKTAASVTNSAGPKAAPAGKARSYAAISDAGQYETRPMLYQMTPEERAQKAPAMLAVALSEIRAFASSRPGPPVPKTASISDYDLRVFDLDFSNTPTEVLTAKLPVANPKGRPFSYYVTVVARLDINNQPQKIFSVTSDSTHLDAYPRLELIDAIDADANGRGDLLFRQYSDVGSSYALYRVFPYQMEKIFEGGSSL